MKVCRKCSETGCDQPAAWTIVIGTSSRKLVCEACFFRAMNTLLFDEGQEKRSFLMATANERYEEVPDNA